MGSSFSRISITPVLEIILELGRTGKRDDVCLVVNGPVTVFAKAEARPSFGGRHAAAKRVRLPEQIGMEPAPPRRATGVRVAGDLHKTPKLLGPFPFLRNS